MTPHPAIQFFPYKNHIIINRQIYQFSHYQIPVLKLKLLNYQMSQNQRCVTCGLNYDYYQRIATTICPQHHIVCKQCSDKLYKTKSKCPYCLSPLLGSNPYGVRESFEGRKQVQYNNQNMHQNYYDQGPVNQNYQNQNHPYQNGVPVGQPVYAQPQNPHNQAYYGQNQQNQPLQPNQNLPYNPRPQIGYMHSRPRLTFCCTIFCLIMMIGAITTCVQIQSCNFWGYQDCYFPQQMCCAWYFSCSFYSSYECSYIEFVENYGLVVLFYICAFLFGFGFIMFSILSCRNRRNLQQLRPLGAGNYVRV